MEMESRNLAVATPEPHSCKHCQKLILNWPGNYIKKVRGGVRDADESSLVPSQGVLSWLKSVELPGSAGTDCIFDITIAEMREAAVQGCDLFDLLLENCTADIPEASFVAAHDKVWDSTMNFYILSQTSEPKGNKASMIPLLPRGERDFTVCADAGTVSLI
jgi:hypothetical protein